MFFELKQRMRAKSAALLLSIETRLDRLMMGWLLFAGLATAIRIATSPLQGPFGAAGVFPYLAANRRALCIDGSRPALVRQRRSNAATWL